MAELDLLFADAHCLVVVKPADLPSVPGRSAELQDCLWRRVQTACPDALVVHRLDMATSGLMLFARGAAAQRTLSIAFAQRRVQKHYVALVAGTVTDDAGRIDLPLGADWPNRPRQQVDSERGKPSLTHYTVLHRDRETTRLRLEPHTGRSHQLRVHLQAIGHPIVGDRLYAPPAVQAQAPRLLLHASGIAFEHPAHATPLRFQHEAPF